MSYEIKIPGTFVGTSEKFPYPLIDDSLISGGLKIVKDITELNAIPEVMLKDGTLGVLSQDGHMYGYHADQKQWELLGDLNTFGRHDVLIKSADELQKAPNGDYILPAPNHADQMFLVTDKTANDVPYLRHYISQPNRHIPNAFYFTEIKGNDVSEEFIGTGMLKLLPDKNGRSMISMNAMGDDGFLKTMSFKVSGNGKLEATNYDGSLKFEFGADGIKKILMSKDGPVDSMFLTDRNIAAIVPHMENIDYLHQTSEALPKDPRPNEIIRQKITLEGVDYIQSIVWDQSALGGKGEWAIFKDEPQDSLKIGEGKSVSLTDSGMTADVIKKYDDGLHIGSRLFELTLNSIGNPFYVDAHKVKRKIAVDDMPPMDENGAVNTKSYLRSQGNWVEAPEGVLNGVVNGVKAHEYDLADMPDNLEPDAIYFGTLAGTGNTDQNHLFPWANVPDANGDYNLKQLTGVNPGLPVEGTERFTIKSEFELKDQGHGTLEFVNAHNSKKTTIRHEKNTLTFKDDDGVETLKVSAAGIETTLPMNVGKLIVNNKDHADNLQLIDKLNVWFNNSKYADVTKPDNVKYLGSFIGLQIKATGAGDTYKHVLEWVDQDEYIYSETQRLVDEGFAFPADMMTNDWNLLVWCRRPSRSTGSVDWIPYYEAKSYDQNGKLDGVTLKRLIEKNGPPV